jgi:hypothetical protein
MMQNYNENNYQDICDAVRIFIKKKIKIQLREKYLTKVNNTISEAA